MLRKIAQNKEKVKRPTKALPERLSQRQIRRGVRRIVGTATRCVTRYGKRGMVTVKIAVQGATGQVTRARVVGPLAGTPAAACVERTFRSLRFRRFKATHHYFTAPVFVR